MKPKRFLIIVFTIAVAPALHAQTAGSVDLAFNPNVTGNYIQATSVQPDGKILLGGLLYQREWPDA